MGFRHVLSLLLGNKLHLMVSETFQLSEHVMRKIPKDGSEEGYDKTIEIIIREISSGTVVSCHMSKSEATKALRLLHGDIEIADPSPEFKSDLEPIVARSTDEEDV